MPHRLTVICFEIIAAISSTSVDADVIVNGDFEAGNTGFTSQYTFAAGVNRTEGEYTVAANPQSWNGAFNNMPDHTSGTGNMLIVNGATSGSPFLWRQTVAVSSGTVYDFSSWVSTAVGGGPAVLNIQVNGIQVGGQFTAPSNPGTWENWTTTWNSGVATTADIQILNSNLSRFPNDFYIDDISFTASTAAVPEPSAFALIALGTVSCLYRRRKRTSSKQPSGERADWKCFLDKRGEIPPA